MKLRVTLAGIIMLTLVGCGGSGGLGGGAVPNPDAWREAVANVTDISLGEGSSPVLPSQAPTGRVGMAGGFGARVGGTNEAIFGGAHMLADFDASRVDGWVDQLALYEVAQDLPLSQANPIKSEDLRGTIDFDGAIELLPAQGEGIWFDSGYRGTLTGDETELRLLGRTDRGAFLFQDGKLVGFGNVDGSVTRARDGLSRVFVLREGKIYVRAP